MSCQIERAFRFVEVLKNAAADPSNRSSIDPPLFRLSKVGVELMLPNSHYGGPCCVPDRSRGRGLKEIAAPSRSRYRDRTMSTGF